MMRKVWIATLLALLCVGIAQAQKMEVITLKGALPEQVLPLIEQVLKPDETVKVFRGQLIVVASESSMQRIYALLSEVDRPPRNLVIQVSDTVSASGSESDLNVSGSVGDDNARIQVNERRPSQEDHLRVSGKDSRTNIDASIQQQVRAVEGYPAFIAQSQQAPVAVDRYGRQTVGVQATQGFFVTARLQGGQVFLDISTSHDSLEATRVNKRRTSTTVSGRLGEWIELSGMSAQSSAQSAGIGQSGSVNQGASSTLSLRVTLTD